MTIQTITTDHGFAYLQCDCERQAIRIRTQSNGVRIYVLQCLACGRQIRAVSKNAPEVLAMPERVPFDAALQDAWTARQQELRAASERVRAEARAMHTTVWWQQYTAYLQTPAWRAKRAAVLERDNDLCQGCRARRATQVHHTTYDHVTNELLFELIAVCDECHRVLHPEMDER